MHRCRQYLASFGRLKKFVAVKKCGINGGRFTGAMLSQARKYVHSSAGNTQTQTKLQDKTSPLSATLLDSKFLVVTLEDGSTQQYPTPWLRDNCQCSACFSPLLNSRTIDWKTFDPDVKPIGVQVSNGEFVDVSWADGHTSSFHVNWLKNRSFEPSARQHWLDDTYRPPKKPWGAAEFPGIMHRFNFKDVIDSDDHLLAWMESMAKYGIAIIENTPQQRDQVRKIADRVAFIKKTHYGEEFEVIAKADTSNLAYLAVPLQLHTDLPYYEYKPGFNLLHCLVQTQGEGGANQITDCLNVSNILRERHPEDFRILTQTLIEWNDIGADLEGSFYSIFRAPAICLDRNGKFDRVNYSQQQRDSHMKIPLEDVIPWYRAHKTLTNLIHHPDNTVFFKTKPGEILTFDNVRFVHGRTGYDDVEGNVRHLIGVYVDWDIVYSKIRILKRRKKGDKYA